MKRLSALCWPFHPFDFAVAAAGILALLLIVLLGSGCHVPGSPDASVNFVQTVSKEAAYVGAALDLQEHPDHRPAYAAGVVALQSLVDRSNYSAAAFSAVLDALPAKLTGSQGAIVIDAGVSLWTVASGWWDFDSAPYVRAGLLGTLAGLQEALAVPTSWPAARIRPPLPRQCTVPDRPK